MKNFFQSSVGIALGMVVIASACSHNDDGGGPAKMAPLSAANLAEVKKTVNNVSGVHSAVTGLNSARKAQNQSGQGTGSQAASTPIGKALVGQSVGALLGSLVGDSSSIPVQQDSDRVQKMMSKMDQASCDVSVQSTGMKTDDGSIDPAKIDPTADSQPTMTVHAGGAKCPITYDLNLSGTSSGQGQASMVMTVSYKVNSDDFRSLSDVQSMNLTVKFDMTVAGSQNSGGTMTGQLSGSGQIVTTSQGTISFYSNGSMNLAVAPDHSTSGGLDMHFGLVYPGFKADLRAVSNMSNGKSTGQLYLNDQPITEDDLKKMLAQPDASSGPVSAPANPGIPNSNGQPLMSYEIKDPTCAAGTTGKHDFYGPDSATAQAQYCQALTDDGLNQNCAKAQRQQMYAALCSVTGSMPQPTTDSASN